MKLLRLCVPWLPFVATTLACSSETVPMWPAPPVHWQSANRESEDKSSPATPTVYERALADAYTAALSSPHCADLARILAEQAHLFVGAKDTHGRDRVVKAHDEALGAFDDRRFIKSRIWLTDSTHVLDTQTLEWTMTGVQAGAWMGVPASHKPVVIKGLTLIWTDDDGIIADLHTYFDEEVVKAQIDGGPAELKGAVWPPGTRDQPRMHERQGTAEEAANVKTVRGAIQALEDGDENAYVSAMAEDVDVFTLDHAEPVHGKQAAHAYFRVMRGGIRLLDTVIENAWGVESFVVAEYSINGLQLAPLPRVPFSAGRSIHTQYADVVELRDGKIVRIWRYADPVAFASL